MKQSGKEIFMEENLIDAYHLYFKEREHREHNQKYGTGLEKVEHYKV
jgi:hypothetical protein